MKFDDHFSGHAGQYARYRPQYPAELFRWIARRAPGNDTVWDCATGNGQAALGLADHFKRVFASDASTSQVAHGYPNPRIAYFAATAYHSGLATHSMHAVTVAQALHWFHFDSFYREVKRILRKDGILAAWCYTRPRADGPIDDIIYKYWADIVGPYWPEERRYVDDEYRTVPFPFRDDKVRSFESRRSWNLHQLLGYLSTWSAAKYYRDDNSENAIDAIRTPLSHHWGDPETEQTVRWPIHLRIGRV